jgi:hypothetical protein
MEPNRQDMIDAIAAALDCGQAIPYLGPGVIALAGESALLPASSEALAAKLTSKISVPHKIRKNLTAAAQFIENFKHRKTLKTAMTGAFRLEMELTMVHRWLAGLPALPLLVSTWYDDLPQRALAARDSWGMVQGVSQAEHTGKWVHYFRADGSRAVSADETGNMDDEAPVEAAAWATLLYQPMGSVGPVENYLVSDSDFVEVLTEIDIQTPIPQPVRDLRKGRHFLFLGCRFATQMERLFARQIMKRSSGRHWAVLPDAMTKNEARFLEEQNIGRLEMGLAEFVETMANSPRLAAAC